MPWKGINSNHEEGIRTRSHGITFIRGVTQNGISLSVYVISIVLFLLATFSGCGKDESSEDLNALKTQIAQLEEKIFELSEKSKQVDHIAGKVYDMEESLSGTERLVQSLYDEQVELAKSIKQLAKKTATQTKKTTPPVSRDSSVSKKKNRYYTVKTGDTLYSIARNNDISVDELLRFNKLSKKAVIHPGQKLIVGKGSSR